jgi:alpha-beta hydrolase superfamily lysophospholipase
VAGVTTAGPGKIARYLIATHVPTTAEPVAVQTRAGHTLRGLRWPASKRAPVCLLIHGLAVDANVWQFVAPRLQSEGFAPLCLELDGHGESDQGVAATPDALACNLADACGRLGVRPACIVAQSLGAWIGLELMTKLEGSPPLFAITPVWTGRQRRLASALTTAAATVRFLYQLGRRSGWRARVRGRRDHTRFAGMPDAYMPRFAEEAASVGWTRYARLLGWLRASAYRNHFWECRAPLPVVMFGASRDGLWDGRNLEVIHRATSWPLYWIDMTHISLATKSDHVDELIALLVRNPHWPKAGV